MTIPSIKSWVVYCLLIAVFAAIIVLLFFVQLPVKTYFHRELQNTGHTFLFLTLSLVLSFSFRILSRRMRAQTTINIVIVAIICVVVAASTEILQAQHSRLPSWLDFWLDVGGTLSGLSMYLFVVGPKNYKRYFSLLAIIPLLLAFRNPILIKVAEHHRTQAFPLIADFDNKWLNYFVENRFQTNLEFVTTPLQWSELISEQPSQVAKLTIKPGPWPGIALFEVETNWEGSDQLTFDVYNPSNETLNVRVRIHDKHHNKKYNDRFSRIYPLKPGLSKIEIDLNDVYNAPTGRTMDFESMSQIYIFMQDPTQTHTLYFDNFTLL